ncbi:hypothetical protein [Spirosoma flavus]
MEDLVYLGEDSQKRYGFGLPNVAGGYELRRYGDWAKTAVGPKQVTLFKADRPAAPWHCFYSLIDFGTFLTVDKPPVGAYHFLIINSDGLVDKAIACLQSMPAGHMVHYPHQDASGQRAYQALWAFLVSQHWGGSDRSPLYAGFKDWTEARQQQLGLSPRVINPVGPQ